MKTPVYDPDSSRGGDAVGATETARRQRGAGKRESASLKFVSTSCSDFVGRVRSARVTAQGPRAASLLCFILFCFFFFFFFKMVFLQSWYLKNKKQL